MLAATIVYFIKRVRNENWTKNFKLSSYSILLFISFFSVFLSPFLLVCVVEGNKKIGFTALSRTFLCRVGTFIVNKSNFNLKHIKTMTIMAWTWIKYDEMKRNETKRQWKSRKKTRWAGRIEEIHFEIFTLSCLVHGPRSLESDKRIELLTEDTWNKGQTKLFRWIKKKVAWLNAGWWMVEWTLEHRTNWNNPNTHFWCLHIAMQKEKKKRNYKANWRKKIWNQKEIGICSTSSIECSYADLPTGFNS